MVIEVGGVYVLYNIIHQDELVAKLETQVLVVIGNYFISRFLVFRDRK
jgi:putative flippase GtrA